MTLRVMSPKDVVRMANSVDLNQTTSSLICVHTVFPGLSVRKLRIINGNAHSPSRSPNHDPDTAEILLKKRHL